MSLFKQIFILSIMSYSIFSIALRSNLATKNLARRFLSLKGGASNLPQNDKDKPFYVLGRLKLYILKYVFELLKKIMIIF